MDRQTGREVIPDVDNIKDGLFISPMPFAADIVPRSESRATAVREEWDKVAGLLDENMQWKTVPEGLKWKDYEPLDDENEDILDSLS
jgi:hypothetical protein